MPPVPTPEKAARYILTIFVFKFNCRATHVLRVNNFITPFSEYPWQTSDFNTGMIYAAEQGWVEILKGGATFRLTDAGFNEASEETMDLKEECNEQVTLEKADGSRREDIQSLVTKEMVLIPDGGLPIETGDAILRKLPSGLVDRLIVTDPGFYARIHGMPEHFQVRYRREAQKPEGSPGYVIHQHGSNSRVNIGSVDNSTNIINELSQTNMVDLAAQLTTLRGALLSKAKDAGDYAAIGQIATAETAAAAGDRSKVAEALSMLGGAAKWVLDVGKDLGVAVAAEYIKKASGM